MTAEEKERARRLYAEGHGAYEVARLMGRSTSTIYDWLGPVTLRSERKLTAEQHRDLQRRYDKGSTVAELSEETGLSVGLIVQYLDKRRMRPRGKRPIDRARVLRLHAKGLGTARIAALLGCHPDTVRGVIRRFAPREES